MKRPVEYAGTQFRGRTFEGAALTSGAGGFSVAETRSIMEARPGLSKINDLRLLGCPEHIFSRIIANRAAAVGIRHEITDADRKAAALKTAATLAEDAKRLQETHDRIVSLYSPENQF